MLLPPQLKRQHHIKQNKDFKTYFTAPEYNKPRPNRAVSSPRERSQYPAPPISPDAGTKQPIKPAVAVSNPPSNPRSQPVKPTITPINREFRPTRKALSYAQRVSTLYDVYASPLSTLDADAMANSNTSTNLAYHMFQPTKPTISVMEPRAQMNAELVNISEIYHKSGLNLEVASAELNKINVRNGTSWSIDPALSTHESLVVVNPQNEAVVAMRGTDIKNSIKQGLGKGTKEYTIWGGILAGNESQFEYFKATQRTIVSAMEKYNVLNLTGYSLGGTAAIKYGNQYSIESLTTNPFLGKNIITHNGNNPNINHTITRTTSDFATTLLILNGAPSNTLINTIDPLVKSGGIASKIRDTHSNRHFTENAQRFNTQEALQIETAKLAANYGDVEMRSAAISAIEDELSFTEWLIRSGNTGDITNNNGVQELAPARTGRGTPYYEIWETESTRLNATPFNETERSILVNSPEPTTIYTSPLSVEEIATVRATRTPDERLALANEYSQRIMNITAFELPTIAFQNNMTQTFMKNLVNLPRYGAIGIGSVLGGVATGALLGSELQNMNPIVASIVTGSAGNIATDVLLSRLVTQSFAPKLMTLATGAVIGGVAAPLQVIASMGASAILNVVGLTGDANDILSQTAGAALAARSAIALAPIITTEIEAIGTAFGLAAAEEAVVASTATANPFIIAGTVVASAAIAGGFAIYQAVQPKNDFMLLPDRQLRADTAIGQDAQVVAIMTEFNRQGLWKPEDQAIASQAIQARALEMQNSGMIMPDYNFTARFQAVPRGYAETVRSAADYRIPSAILQATYPQNFINTGVRTPAEQQQYDFDNRETRQQRDIYIKNLDTSSAEAYRTLASHFDTKDLNISQLREVIQVTEDNELTEKNISNVNIEELLNTQRAGLTETQQEHLIVTDIKRDPEVASLIRRGDTTGANQRIVEYIQERAQGAHRYRDLIEYNDPFVPQIINNELTYNTITEAINKKN